ncbi:hypothetical protein ACQEU6_01640 [Spirillospora sp. CA-108201]
MAQFECGLESDLRAFGEGVVDDLGQTGRQAGRALADRHRFALQDLQPWILAGREPARRPACGRAKSSPR